MNSTSANLQAIDFATSSQLVLHSLSVKKLITECMHSRRMTDKPRSSRSKKRYIRTTINSSASEVEMIEYFLQRCQVSISTELKQVESFSRMLDTMLTVSTK